MDGEPPLSNGVLPSATSLGLSLCCLALVGTIVDGFDSIVVLGAIGGACIQVLIDARVAAGADQTVGWVMQEADRLFPWLGA